jgi:hypothetical protein
VMPGAAGPREWEVPDRGGTRHHDACRRHRTPAAAEVRKTTHRQGPLLISSEVLGNSVMFSSARICAAPDRRIAAAVLNLAAGARIDRTDCSPYSSRSDPVAQQDRASDS